jgi:hypothetical protein
MSLNSASDMDTKSIGENKLTTPIVKGSDKVVACLIQFIQKARVYLDNTPLLSMEFK